MSTADKKRILIKVFATLRKFRVPEAEEEFPQEASVAEILDGIGIPEEKAAVIFINGRHGELTFVPSDGDTLAIFPPVGGG
jgi:molybdopterin converting factor small subunit